MEEQSVGRHLRFGLRRHGAQLRPVRIDLSQIVRHTGRRATLHTEVVGRRRFERADDEAVVRILLIAVLAARHFVGELTHHFGFRVVGLQQLPRPFLGTNHTAVVVPLHDYFMRIGTIDVQVRRHSHTVRRLALHLEGTEVSVAEFNGYREKHRTGRRGFPRNGHAHYAIAGCEGRLARLHRQALGAFARDRGGHGHLLAAQRTCVSHSDEGIVDCLAFGHIALYLRAVDMNTAVFLHDGHLAVEPFALDVQFGSAFDARVTQRLDRHALRNDSLVARAARLVERQPVVARQVVAIQRPRHCRTDQQLLVGLLVVKFQFFEIRRQTTRRIVVRAACECQRRQQDDTHPFQFE